MKFNGIQAQLFLAFGCLVLIVNLSFTRLSFLFVEISEDIFAYYLVEKEQQHIIHYFQSTGRLEVSHKGEYELVLDAKDIVQAWQPTTYRANFLKWQTEHGYSYYKPFEDVSVNAVGVVMRSSAVAPLLAYTDVFSLFLFSVALATIILTILCTWFLASRLAMPIQLLNRSVKQQLPAEKCEIDGVDRRDEIGDLAQTFQSTYAALQQAWERERDFTRDVSHELRTPITLLKNTLTINPNTIPQLEERQLVEQATTTLQQTVEVLLALARKENLAFTTTPLLPIVERVLLAIYQLYPQQEFVAEVSVPPDFVVIGNEYLITLLCQNLVNNGFYHGGGNGMKISVEGEKIVFANPVGDETARPYYQGLGHGQYLVNRITNVMDWTLDFEQSQAQYKVVIGVR